MFSEFELQLLIKNTCVCIFFKYLVVVQNTYEKHFTTYIKKSQNIYKIITI